MLPVQVRGNHRFITISKEPLGELHSCGVGSFGCDLARGIGMDDVIAQYAAPLVPAAFRLLHFGKGSLRLAVDAGYKLMGLFCVCGIGQRMSKAGLLSIQHIVHTVV